MPRSAKSSTDRVKAARLRAKRKRGSKLTAAETKFLATYEQDTARWKDPDQVEDLEDLEDGELGDRDAGVNVPVHRAPTVAGDRSAWMSQPTLPPAAASQDAPGASSSPEGSQGADAAAAGGTFPPPDAGAAAGPPPSSARPIVDAPAPAPVDPAAAAAALHDGAMRFAGLVVGINTAGLAALLELVDIESLPLPDTYKQLVLDESSHKMLLAFIGSNAYQTAIKHPWICGVTPSCDAITIGATAVSGGALWAKWIRPLLAKDGNAKDDDAQRDVKREAKRDAQRSVKRSADNGNVSQRDAERAPAAPVPEEKLGPVSVAEAFQ